MKKIGILFGKEDTFPEIGYVNFLDVDVIVVGKGLEKIMRHRSIGHNLLYFNSNRLRLKHPDDDGQTAISSSLAKYQGKRP